MTDRIQVFDQEPVPFVSGLLGLTEPDPSDRVRAIIDIPLIGPPSAGKSQLAAALLRTLKARAPELPKWEAEENRAVMRAVMGGSPQRGPRKEGAVPHYIFRVSIASLLEMLPAGARIGALLRSSRLQLPIGTALFCAVLSVCAGVFFSPLLAAGFAAAAIAFVTALFLHTARLATARAEADGDVELVLWDPPGDNYRPDRAADTYDFLAHLARRRRQTRPAWRGYSFLPGLVVNPIDYGSTERRRDIRRLRELLPMFAALDGEKPRALVAVNRWALVAGACPSGSSKDESITVTASDRDGETSKCDLPRMQIATELVETEDGNEAGVDIRYLRYEAATDADIDLRNDSVEYTAVGGGGTLVGASRTSIVRTVLELALAPTGGYQASELEPHQDENDGGFAPDDERARVTLEAMTSALGQ